MLAIAGVALASIGSITGLFIANQRKGLIAELERQADLALDSLTLAAASLNLQAANSGTPIILPSTEVRNIQSRGAIFSSEGVFLAGVGNAAGDWNIGEPSLSGFERFGHESDTRYIWQADRLLAGRRVNARSTTTVAETKVVVVEISTTALKQHLQQALVDATHVALGASALSTLLALLLSRTIAGSLKQMVVTTDRIASGRFAERLPVNKGGYELSSFAQSFNLMAAQLQKTIARQRALVRYSLDAIVVLNQQGQVMELNPCAEKLFGSEEEILGSRFAEWAFAPPWREQVQTELVAVARGEDSGLSGHWQEIEAQQLNGTRFPAEMSMTHTNVQGDVLFTVTLRDITERHRVEIRLQQSEARFRQIVHSVSIGIALVDAGTQLIQQVNPALCAIVGYDESDLLGSPFDSLGLNLPCTKVHDGLSDSPEYPTHVQLNPTQLATERNLQVTTGELPDAGAPGSRAFPTTSEYTRGTGPSPTHLAVIPSRVISILRGTMLG